MDNPDISLLFYRYLCDVIGTEDVVHTRRHILTALQYVGAIIIKGDKSLGKTRIKNNVSVFQSGSKAEGLDIDGSDFDIMLRSDVVQVYENKDKARHVSRICPLLMDTSDCKPGFTKLKIPDPNQPCAFFRFCKHVAGEWFMSSITYRDEARFEEPYLITHGPCKSSPDGLFDYVACLQCNDWISQAHSWLSRSRQQWPCNNVMDNVVNSGVLFVPIGCKNSPYADLEWRISFSFAEKLLIWSFNHIQLMCYALLKILLKEIIKHFAGDLLCSYFLKTVMFWVCEETRPDQWSASNMLSCFMTCLDRLIYCVQNETCVHYFIPENDLFENRFNRQQHTKLLSTLNRLRSLGWTCLLQTQTLQSFHSFLQPSLSHDLYCCSFIGFITFFIYSRSCSFRFKIPIYNFLRAKQNKFYIYSMSVLSEKMAQTFSKEDLLGGGTKINYNIYRRRLCHLLMGLNHDAVSGWLYLASFFYVNKQYKECKLILSDCLMKCTSEKHLPRHNTSKAMETRMELLSRSLNIKPFTFVKTYFISHVGFESGSQIVPKELDMFECNSGNPFPPVALGVFLKFLCDHHLDNQREKVRSRLELANVVKNDYFIMNGNQRDISYTMLSIANSLT